MRFTVEILGACSANNHVNARVTLPDHGNRTRDILITKSEHLDTDREPAEVEDLIVERIVSFARENRARWSTLGQLKTLIEAAEFDV